eukprot:m.65224 g.65224  ORF g.65224 m.65224 type:complete len:62 (+) comp17960_c0_seq1:58-243(+)
MKEGGGGQVWEMGKRNRTAVTAVLGMWRPDVDVVPAASPTGSPTPPLSHLFLDCFLAMNCV